MVDEKLVDIQNEVIESAKEHIQNQRDHIKSLNVRTYCLTAVLIVAIVCGTIVACLSVFRQQAVINQQYTDLLDYIKGLEFIVEYDEASSSGDGSIAVVGDGNITAGGDLNGQ